MLFSSAIGVIISIIFLNFGYNVEHKILNNQQPNRPPISGETYDWESDLGLARMVADQKRDLRLVLMSLADQLKKLPRPSLWQPAGLKEPIKRTVEASQPMPLAADFNFSAENGAMLDCQKDDLVFSRRSDRSWPIASITKLFTAYTFLDYNPGWEKTYEIKASDKREGGKIYLFTGDLVTVKDLFYFSLVGSDNTATAALVSATGLSEEEFVARLNAKAAELGLKHTRLLDPAGLKDGNLSTARDVANFAKVALAEENISRAVLTKNYQFKTKQGRAKTIATTDELLYEFPQDGVSLLGGKTGYVTSSGYCLVGKFRGGEDREVVTVVLGAKSNADRFSLTKDLVNLYFKD